MIKNDKRNKYEIIYYIPNINATSFLPDLFEALDRNTYETGDEILLVDNGSTDNSVELCKEQVSKRPNLYRLLLFTDRPGSYAARNYGVKQSNGDILVFTDSDTKPVLLARSIERI